MTAAEIAAVVLICICGVVAVLCLIAMLFIGVDE